MQNEKFFVSAHADRDTGNSKPNIRVIQKMRQMSSSPHLANFNSESMFDPDATWTNKKQKKMWPFKRT